MNKTWSTEKAGEKYKERSGIAWSSAEEEKILKNYYFERQARLLNTFLLLLFSHHLNDDRWLAASPPSHPSRYQQQLMISMRSESTIDAARRSKDTAINRYMRALSFARPIHKMPGRRTQKTFRKSIESFTFRIAPCIRNPSVMNDVLYVALFAGFWYAENNLIHISTPLALVSVCRCFENPFASTPLLHN